jgi:glutathione-regulated potassium-efflux system ancillary protein KefC/glutathione-regulated potassium-efflux system protein KefB
MSMLFQTSLFLGAAVCFVPLFKRLGLGAILGYLAAGVAIGPWALGLVDDVDSILHFAEIGVVLLLFIIGLELQPSRLWVLRKSVFGLGAVQVGVTALCIALLAHATGVAWPAAIIIGLGLSLSSTAFALQVLAEKKQLTTRHGRSAFSILLFQDLVVVPVLAIVPVLSPSLEIADSGSPWLTAAGALAVIVAVVAVGRFLVGRVFKFIAETAIREVFTAASLLLVIGTGLLLESAGLSLALGAFLAGVLLADSEYRHALEADIEPFKGLLLGLFFIAVGMSLNLGLILERPGLAVGLALALLIGKFLLIAILGVAVGKGFDASLRLGAVIAQGGEFAFVIFGVATATGALGHETAALLVVVVTLSMALTPPLFALTEFVARRRGALAETGEPPIPEGRKVIIAGFGRVGQIVGRILRAKRIGFTALDSSPEHIDFVKKFGNEIYYGDASRLDLLEAAGARDASLVVVAIDDMEASLRTVRVVRENFPHLRIYARARNRRHAYLLMDLGVSIFRRETFESSLELARLVLEGLGLPHAQASRLVETFKRHDIERLNLAHSSHTDQERMIYLAKEAAKELEEMFEQDEAQPATADTT